MFNMVELGVIFALLGTIVIKGEELTWNEAYSSCKQENKIIQKKNLTSTLYTSGQSWTPNYLLHFSCVKDIALYVEQLPKTEKHRSLCHDIKRRKGVIVIGPHNYSNADFTCKWDYRPSGLFPDSLLQITSASILTSAISRMEIRYKYWISNLSFDFCPFNRQCEKERQTSLNHSKVITLTDCHEKHGFACQRGTHFRTAISIIKVIQDSFNENGSTVKSDVTWQITTVVLSVFLLVGVGVTCFVFRRVFVSLKHQLDQLREQRYHQPMYNADQVQMIQNAPEPDTPISPSGTSLYENFANSDTETEDNITVSYRQTTQVEARVEVRGHRSQITSHIQGNVLPSQGFKGLRTPPKGRRLQHQSLTDYYKDRRRLFDCRQTSTEPGRRFPFEYCLRGMPDAWFKGQDEPLYTKPQKPMPNIQYETSDENNEYVGPDSPDYFNTCREYEGENPNYEEPTDYEDIWHNQ